MSNTRRCREAHGGMFTRPKNQWKGRRRHAYGSQRRFAAATPPQNFNKAAFTSAVSMVKGRNFGQLAFRRKAG